jgi:hypothetical protein
MSGVGRQSCDECRETYESAARKRPYEKKAPVAPKPTPCGECRPELLPENLAPFQLYDRVADEWLAGPSGALIGIPTPSIESAMRICGIPGADRKAYLDDVKLISRTVAGEHRKERKKEENNNADPALRPHSQ